MGYELTVLDEAYDRLHKTGPEFRGWLSNHGPMAVEAMIRHGHGESIQPWLDGYVRRLEPFPASHRPIGTEWPHVLGDMHRVADWTRYFEEVLAEQPWRTALNEWWPRLLLGIAAGATHGVIRVGHAVRALLTGGESPLRINELAHGLAYWAARWQPVTASSDFWDAGAEDGGMTNSSLRTVDDTLVELPQLAPSQGGRRFDEWVSRMDEIPGWVNAVHRTGIPRDAEAVREWLSHVVDAAAVRYLWYGHGNGIMLVHSATAPNAVWRTLPALDQRWWRPSALAAWIGMATLTTIYASATPVDSSLRPSISPSGLTPQDAFARAVAHGDEHVIKFADTALDVYARTHDLRALAAVHRAAALIEP